MNKRQISTTQPGFTLLEIAIVLSILILIIGILLSPLRQSINNARRAETTELLQDAHNSLLAYAVIEGNLPCPDCRDNNGACAGDEDHPVIPNDGIEDRQPRAHNDTSNDCRTVFGNLPWQTLSIRTEDAWGHSLLYRVSRDFADYGIDCNDLKRRGPTNVTPENYSPSTCRSILAIRKTEDNNGVAECNSARPHGFGNCNYYARRAEGTRSCNNYLSDTPPGMSFCLASVNDGDINVFNDVDANGDPINAINVPALILSTGEYDGQINNCIGDNCMGNSNNDYTQFYSTDYGRRRRGFDDLILWISPNNLMYHLVRANRLSFNE